MAATLNSRGIQGVRNAVRFLNPIVHYLETEVASVAPSIRFDLIPVDRVRLVYGDGHGEEVVLPAGVRQFLESFNQGKYPELLLPEDHGPG